VLRSREGADCRKARGSTPVLIGENPPKPSSGHPAVPQAAANSVGVHFHESFHYSRKRTRRYLVSARPIKRSRDSLVQT